MLADTKMAQFYFVVYAIYLIQCNIPLDIRTFYEWKMKENGLLRGNELKFIEPELIGYCAIDRVDYN